MSLQLTSDLGFSDALTKVVRRIFRSIAFRQLLVITACMLLVRFALNSVLRLLAKWSASPVQWDKSKLYYVMKEVYSPLELLLFIAGCCTIADSFVPQLINVPKATVTHVVRAVLSVSFVVGASVVVYNLKSRFCKEQAWQMEMQGDITSQRRWEAYDKLGTFGIYAIGIVLAIQALGLEVRSVLAIGGIGGLAIGLAGREICENLLNGMLLMTTMPFEVGEEVCFRPNGQLVEGIVVDVGWYRTLIRSFEREMYVIPNAVFSKNTVLNVTRKQREWRFYEFLCVRVADVHKVNAIIQDIRRIVRNDSRIINKLHRRVFMDKISLDDVKIYVSFYCEASNRDAFMAIKQDLLLAFVDCVERNGAKLAQPRTVLEMDQESLLPRLMTGLLPAPGGSSGSDLGLSMMGYGRSSGGSSGGGGMPITVQVVDTVDSVEVTAVPVGSSSSSSSNGGSKEGAAAAAKAGSSSSSKSSGGGGSGSSGGSSGGSRPASTGSSGSAAAEQQQQLQPVAAAAAAGGSVAYAAAGGARLDAAGMAAGSNAQRKGQSPGGSSSSSGRPPWDYAKKLLAWMFNGAE
ncbi:hypothetical protein OEZ85_000126 [Tetradesmus obliquus]|uniref:Mechanosensitive ion channel protein n=1 Tax=Tetradesmus obliquus TaxID=3088 RepID=A0ABY8URS8_TETOB|nr:hypothetical protein OEZ85_000126 [Tetradesmus obliquus]